MPGTKGIKEDAVDIIAVLLWAGIPFEVEKKRSTVYVSTDVIRFSFSPNRIQRVYQKRESGHWRVLTEYASRTVRVIGRYER